MPSKTTADHQQIRGPSLHCKKVCRVGGVRAPFQGVADILECRPKATFAAGNSSVELSEISLEHARCDHAVGMDGHFWKPAATPITLDPKRSASSHVTRKAGSFLLFKVEMHHKRCQVAPIAPISVRDQRWSREGFEYATRPPMMNFLLYITHRRSSLEMPQ